MGDETGDDEALARALAAQEEEHAYALGVAYPTFRPPAKRRRPDPPGKTAQPKSPETATEPPSALLAKKQKVTVTLAHLIDYGVIVPGDDALATSYCDVTTTADLEADGTIVWRREKYRSVSAFSLAFKRSVKPDRKADDGWKCVRYVGVRDATGGGDESSVSQRGVDAVSDARAPMPAAADPDGDTLDALKRRLADDGSARAAAARRGDGAAVAAARARSDAERAAREAAERLASTATSSAESSVPSSPARNTCESSLSVRSTAGGGPIKLPLRNTPTGKKAIYSGRAAREWNYSTSTKPKPKF